MANETDAITESKTTAVGNQQIDFPELLTVTVSPHIHDTVSTRKIMLDVLIALMPALIFGTYIFGLRALTVTLLSVVCCVIFEFGYQKLLHKPIMIGDLSAAVTGVLFAFNLPVSIPFWMVAIGSFFAIVVVKQLFGGIGKNVVNPALAGRVFMMLAWPNQMTLFPSPGSRMSLFASSSAADAIASATPLASLKQGTLPQGGVFDLFLGNIGGCIGEVSALLLLAGGVYLLLRRVITWHTPTAFLLTVAFFTFLFPKTPVGDRFSFLACELCAGGLMLGSIFMATDYATTPITKRGRLIFGCGCGLITVFIRYFGTYPEGVSFSILIMNTLVWYLDRLTKPVRFGGLKHGK